MTEIALSQRHISMRKYFNRDIEATMDLAEKEQLPI